MGVVSFDLGLLFSFYQKEADATVIYIWKFFLKVRLRYHPQKGLPLLPVMHCSARECLCSLFSQAKLKLEGNVLNHRVSYSTSRTQEFCEPIHQRCSILRPLRLYNSSPHTNPTSLDGVALQIVILYGIWSHAPIVTEKKISSVSLRMENPQAICTSNSPLSCEGTTHWFLLP